MAIRIVGKDQDKVRHVSCGNCASILEYTLKDTYTRVISDYGGGSDTYRFLNCPCCDEQISVKLH